MKHKPGMNAWTKAGYDGNDDSLARCLSCRKRFRRACRHRFCPHCGIKWDGEVNAYAGDHDDVDEPWPHWNMLVTNQRGTEEYTGYRQPIHCRSKHIHRDLVMIRTEGPRVSARIVPSKPLPLP